jgi:two-component system, OmpR family, response regulator
MNFLKKLFKIKSPKSGIVFIVEDNPMYAKTLETFIKSSFPETKEIKICSTGETCLTELQRDPDVILIDYFLDTNDTTAATGIDIIKKIRTQKPEMNIIVLSSQNEIAVVLEAVKIYNCSYIKKDENAFDRVEEILKEI